MSPDTAGNEQTAIVVAAHVPKHYTASMTMTPDAMYDLILQLRTLAAEFDLETGDPLSELLRACEEAFTGDLPQLPTGEDATPSTA